MKKYQKVTVLEESGIAEEHEKALVISIRKEDKVVISFVHMDGLDIIRAAYALVTAVDELGMMPVLREFVKEGRIVTEDVQFTE